MTALAKVASFLSELIIANFLGTTAEADAYSMISGIHSVIYPMLGIGIWSIFLPQYQKIKTTNQNNAKPYVDKVITVFLIATIIVTLLVFVFAEQIITLAAPGFEQSTKNTASILLRIYSPYFIFSTISSLYAAMLQSHGNFFGSQIRELSSYLPTLIIGPILFSKMGVSGFAIALLIGGILRLIIQLPFVNWGYRYRPNFNFKDKHIKSLFQKTPSAILTSSADQILTLVDKIMASTLTVGSVSSLNYGAKLTNAINGILTNSVGTVLFPEMPKMIAQKKYNDLSVLTQKVLIAIAIIVIPVTIIMLLFSEEIVRLVYARGSFDESSVTITSTVFCGYLIGFYFIGIKQILDKLFYSLGKNNTLMIFNIINVIINIVLNVILIQMMGLSGLAYATSISSIIYITVCLSYLKNSKIRFNIFNYFKKLSKLILINVITLVTISTIASHISANWLINMLITFLVGNAITIFIYNLMKIEEYILMQNKIVKFRNTVLRKRKGA